MNMLWSPLHWWRHNARRPAVSYSAAGAVGAHDRTTVTAIPLAEAPPEWRRTVVTPIREEDASALEQRAVRFARLLRALGFDDVIDFDEALIP